ncbi:hypothetical protein ACWF94_13925 [Streptomyces sp. NPDC055078]
MPRPTAAQLASGSATVIFSAFALLLFTRTTNGLGVAAVGVASMALGLLVATALPMSRAAARTVRRPVHGGRPAAPVDGLTARVAASREPAGVGEHSRR